MKISGKHLFQVIFVGAVFFFLVRNIVLKWGALRAYQFTLKPLPLLLSFFLFLAAFGSMVQGWRSLIGHFGRRLPFPNAFRIILQSALGRYIPGKVWAAAGLIYLGSKWGIPAREGLVCAVLSTSLLIIAGGAVAAVGIAASLPAEGRQVVIPLVLVVGATLVFLHPRVLLALINRGLKLLKKETLGVSYRYSHLVKSFPFYIIFWIAMGGGFALAVSALVEVELSAVRILVSTYALSYITGILAVFAPGGLGVREGVMTYLLGRVFADPLPALLSIFGRLWATVLEGFLLLLVLLIPVFPRESKKEK